MSGALTKKLPFEKTSEASTRVVDTPDIQAARNFDPQFDVLDAATRNEYQMARDDNERRMNSSFSGGVPLSMKLTQPARFAQKLLSQRGVALSQGEDAKKRLQLQQKLGLAELTKGVDTKGKESGYQSGEGWLGGAIKTGAQLATTFLSDERLKEEIKPINPVLPRLGRFEGPVKFRWRATGEADTGVTAQQTEKAFPELVGQDEQGNKTVNYNAMGPMALQAVKELRDELKASRAKRSQRKTT